MPGLRRWPSNTAVSGLRKTGIMLAFPDYAGDPSPASVREPDL
jgi:hypothetical protein